MLTYQDFIAATDRAAFIARAINEHMGSQLWRTAREADEYYAQRNVTIRNVVRTYIDAGGAKKLDDSASNNRLASNFLCRFVRQRVAYLLGNGVSFTRREYRKNERGELYTVDVIKERLGGYFDGDVFEWAKKAVLHGVCYALWDGERLRVFPVTGFVPLLDEDYGVLRAGIRFWRLDSRRPMVAELYEEEGRTEYRQRANAGGGLLLTPQSDRPTPYRVRVARSRADGEWIIGADNYSALPVVPMYGNDLHQSALVGMKGNIDAYDLIMSSFANTVSDCAQIYWLIENQGGMSRDDIRQFMDDIRLRHIASVSTEGFDGTARDALSPYVQEPPYSANKALLDMLEAAMYRDFGALDVHAISAGSTNDHIDAAYQPMDDEVDTLEAEVTKAIQQVLALEGIQDTPQFKRNRISNVRETVQSVILEAPYLDEETVLELFPNLTVDQREAVIQRRAGEGAGIIPVGGDSAQTPAGGAGETGEVE